MNREPQMMNAAVYRGDRQIRVEALPVPRIGPGELLVRVTGCGICATDVSKVDQALVRPPTVLGHEVAGTVAGIGDGVEGFTMGERVVVSHHVPCYACHYCKHGNFSMCRLNSPGFFPLMHFEADRARHYFRRAAESLPPEDRKNMVAAEIMGRIYRENLDAIERSGYRVFGDRIALSRARQLQLALTTWAKTR